MGENGCSRQLQQYLDSSRRIVNGLMPDRHNIFTRQYINLLNSSQPWKQPHHLEALPAFPTFYETARCSHHE